ncbi:hypothetical protein [Sphingopyxis chilensis]
MTTLKELLAFFTLTIALCLIIAILTLAMVQLVRPLLRGAVQLRALTRWRNDRRARGLISENDLAVPRWLKGLVPGDDPLWEEFQTEWGSLDPYSQNSPTSILSNPHYSRIFRSTSDGHFMKQIQDAATSVLAHPSLHTRDYLALTRGASREDVSAILYLDFIARRRPQRLNKLMIPADGAAPGFAESVAAAQQAVSDATEQSLDAIQLSLGGPQDIASKTLSIAVGMSVAAAGAYLTAPRGDPMVPLIIGTLGGLLSTLLYDIAAAFMARRR